MKNKIKHQKKLIALCIAIITALSAYFAPSNDSVTVNIGSPLIENLEKIIK